MIAFTITSSLVPIYSAHSFLEINSFNHFPSLLYK
nr:MAG TPA: hypothetical protein [Caudoviricetes sp.]